MATIHREITVAGHRCLALIGGGLTVAMTLDAGPRILALHVGERPNLLAVHDGVNVTPSGKRYHTRGGHRLWHAPEDRERTYVPDDAPLTWSADGPSATFVQPVEAGTGIEKQLSVTLTGERQLIVDHALTNRGLWPVPLAPWAITQLMPGGWAILPQETTDTGLLPNRHLSLWPYTDIASRHITWDNRYVQVRAQLFKPNKLKLGWRNPAGWLAYVLDDLVFVKQASFDAAATYPDGGCNSECYCDWRFIELETVAPLAPLAPGATVTHREQWSILPAGALAPSPEAIDRWVAANRSALAL